MATKAEVALQSTEAISNIHDLAEASVAVEEAAQALKAAKTAKEIGDAKKALEAARAAKALAVTTLVSTLIDFAVGGDVAAGIGAGLSALTTIQAINYAATAGLAAAAPELVLGVLGLVFNIVIIFGGFFHRKPPRVYWYGTVKIKFDPDTFSFGFLLKTIRSKTIKASQVENAIFNKLKEVVGKINAAIQELPQNDRPYILKYIGLPQSNELEFILNMDAGRATKHVHRRLLEAYVREVGNVINKLNELGKEICYLALAKEIGLSELIDLKINDWIPELTYKAEGIYRKELEKLSIKLLQRREYTRQIKAVWATILAMATHKACERGVKERHWNHMGAELLKVSLDRFNRTPLLKYGVDLYGGLDKLKKLDISYDPEKRFPLSSYNGEIKTTKVKNRLALSCGSEDIRNYIVDISPRVKVRGNEVVLDSPDAFIKLKGPARIKVIKICSKPAPSFAWYIFIHGGRIDTFRGPSRPWSIHIELISGLCEAYIKLVIQFVNYLISEIPEEAVDYLVENVGSVSIHIEERPYRRRIYYTENTDLEHRDEDCIGGHGKYCSCAIAGEIHGHFMKTDGLELSNFYDTNLPEEFNALMQDIIDQYAIWKNGYALEWERRVRDELLPQYREVIGSNIVPFMEAYIKVPEKIPERLEEAKYEILREKEKEAEEIENYLPILEQNKDEIIKMFGVDEYNRLIELAGKRYEQMTGKKAPVIVKAEVVKKENLVYYIIGGLVLGYLITKR